MCLGQPVRVLAVRGDGTADADLGGRTQRIVISTLDNQPHVGDWVLVHSGVALLPLDATDAAERLTLLDAIREPQP